MYRLALLIAILFACAHSPESENACVGLARSFHALASSKDLGASLEDQFRMIRESKEPRGPETDRYLRGILSIIYQYPDLDAVEIRERLIGVCTTDSAGRVTLPPVWDPWR